MTTTKLGYVAAIIGSVIAGAVGAIASGRADHKELPHQVAHSTISAPALTTADLVGVRDELREMRSQTNSRLDGIDQRLSHLEGYVAGKEARAK